jgi:hypothetical protein
MTPSGKIGEEGHDDRSLVGPDAPGPNYQVFDVTNLVVPPGTAWQDDDYVVGTLELPSGRTFLLDLYIECDSAATVNNRMGIYVAEEGAGPFDSAQIPEGRYWRSNSDYGNVGDYGPASTSPMPDTLTWTVTITVSAPPTVDPITIIRARAAFLVI